MEKPGVLTICRTAKRKLVRAAALESSRKERKAEPFDGIQAILAPQRW
jgi:hypothetical protein